SASATTGPTRSRSAHRPAKTRLSATRLVPGTQTERAQLRAETVTIRSWSRPRRALRRLAATFRLPHAAGRGGDAEGDRSPARQGDSLAPRACAGVPRRGARG